MRNDHLYNVDDVFVEDGKLVFADSLGGTSHVAPKEMILKAIDNIQFKRGLLERYLLNNCNSNTREWTENEIDK